MGTNSTFFFQPGEPTRVHPLTPAINQELTAEIGSYHAKALDKIGSLYYSEENYDDYYYGKGSTFPDINGSIGILLNKGVLEAIYKKAKMAYSPFHSPLETNSLLPYLLWLQLRA